VYWQVVGSGDEQQLVVQWNDVGFYGYPGADPITFQAVLNETDGSVRFNYLDLQTDIPFLNEGQGATVGVSGYTSSWAYQSFFVPTYDAPNQYVGTGRSTRIAELPQSSDVFAIDLEAGQSMTVSVTGLGYLYGLALELRDDGGNLLALGAYGTGFDAAIRDFVAPTTGTYFVSIRSETVADYSLLVTRDAAVDTEPNDGQFDAQSIGANGGAVGSLWGPFDSDWYRVTVAEGGSLDLAISVPAAGPGEFVNDLVPRLELTDEAGNSLGVVEGDGSMLSTGPLAAGTYFVAVTAAGAAGGEYVLSVTGASTSLPPFSVAFTLPYDGASIRGALTEYTIHFSDLILLTTLTADDVTFNGVPATAVTVAGGDTAVFAVPDGLPEGMITVSIAAGAISDVQGTLLDAFSGVVYTDLAPPRVIASSLQEGDVLAAGGLVVTITFSEAMSPYVYPYAAPLFGQWFGSYFEPVSIEFDATGTVATFTYADLPEDAYTLYLFSWAITDLAGFALDGEPAWPIPPNGTGDGYEYGDFFVNFVTDNDTQSFPQPLVAVPPTDSLILQTPSDSQGTIGFAGDTDTFTIDVDGGQTLTVLLKPGYSLLGTVELWGPGNTFIDSAVGAFWGGEVLLQTVPAAAAGSYSVVISSADGSLGSYAVGLTLNAALEEEPHGGASNNEPGTAQSIEGSFLPPAGDSQRGAVRGVSGDDDVYSFELAVGQSLTAGLAFDTPLTGVYGPRTDYYSYGVVDVALGDVNGDGIPDMVTASIWGWYIGVRLGVGDGSFGDESYAGSAYSPRDIQLEDVDSDGYLDVVVANYDGGYYGAGLSVFLGDGVGNFTTVLNFDVGYGTTAVAVGDVTGDGAPDLVATSDYDSTVKVLTNNGDRTFGAAVSYPVGAYPVDVALADMDGTSGLDIVTANNLGGYNNESLTILFNTGGGMFGPAVGFPAGLYNVALAVDDLNGDGAMDVVTIDSLSSASLYVLLNSGGGTLQSPAVYALDGLGGSSVAIGDVNGDGAPDVIAAAAYNATFTGSTISVFVNSNDGSGSFGASQSVEATYGTSDIDVGDVDSDGHLDLVAASASSSAVSVLLNVTAPTVLTLFAPDGTELPNPSTGTGEFDALLDGFVAPEAGTYSIRVSSPSVPRDYSLVVTRGAAGGGGGANGEESLSLSPLAVSSTAAFPRDTETALDVSRDGTVSPVDALMVINELNRGGFRRLSADGTDSVRKSAYDVNGDGYVSPADALQVINHIARRTVSDDVLRVSPPTGLATSIPMGGRADGRVAATLHENAFGSDLGLDESLTAIVVGGADDVSPATTESDVWDDADSAWLSDDLELAVSSLAGEE
jgi:hypothetical protein